MLPINWRNQAWFDVAKFVLAAFLFATPWVYAFTFAPAASRNAWVCGVVIGLASICAIISYTEWEEWVSLLFGLWLPISPWLLGFHTTVVSATRANVTLGIAIVLLARVDMWMMRHTPPHVTAGRRSCRIALRAGSTLEAGVGLVCDGAAPHAVPIRFAMMPTSGEAWRPGV